ncbi:MAG TPA: dipeptide/oligopeptide/nickel ABC transporter permease/ATP-binding protein [Chloroflexota bacterium]
MSALVAEVATLPATRSQQSLRRLLRNPVAIAAISFLGIVIAVSIGAAVTAPFDPLHQDLERVLSEPTSHNLLGTDSLGRDVLSRLIYGGRRSLLSVLEGVVVVLALGIPMGLAAGYTGGWADSVLSKFAETIMAVPALIVVLVVLAVLPQNEDAAMISFGLVGFPAILRVVRSVALRVREDLYVTAARVSGLTHLNIVIRHVLPRVWGPVIVQASLFAAYALLFETGIAYLGLTADPSTPTWGGMVAEASTVIERQAWLLIPSGTLIALTILAFGLLGDAVRDAVVAEEGGRSDRARVLVVTETHRRAYSATRLNGRSGLVLRVQDLSVSANTSGGEIPIVDGVSFDVYAGETLGIVGESGCGKTVTALALLRLLPEDLRPAGGQVFWQGNDLLVMPESSFDKLRGSTLAYVSQEPQSSLDPAFTVGSQLIELIQRHDRVSRSMAVTTAIALLRQVGMQNPEQVARSYAHELSGGMAQRVAIAFALTGHPKLLIADEPTTALDVTVQAEILGLLRRIQREAGMAMVLITHNWGVVADVCDRALVMYAGQIVETSVTQEMFDRPLHPYTLALLKAHPSLAQPGSRLTSIPGNVPSPGSWPGACRFLPRCPFAAETCAKAAIPLLDVEPGRTSRCIRVEQIFTRVSA